MSEIGIRWNRIVDFWRLNDNTANCYTSTCSLYHFIRIRQIICLILWFFLQYRWWLIIYPTFTVGRNNFNDTLSIFCTYSNTVTLTHARARGARAWRILGVFWSFENRHTPYLRRFHVALACNGVSVPKPEITQQTRHLVPLDAFSSQKKSHEKTSLAFDENKKQNTVEKSTFYVQAAYSFRAHAHCSFAKHKLGVGTPRTFDSNPRQTATIW